MACIFFYPISKDHFFVYKEVFSENAVLMYGFSSRAAYDVACTVVGSPELQFEENPGNLTEFLSF